MEKKYSVWSHYRYLYSRLWKYSRKLTFQFIGEVIGNALKPLMAVLPPAVIVGLLEQGADMKTLVLACLLVFAVSGLINGVAVWLEKKNWMAYIYVRLEYFWSKLIEKCIDMDYVLYEKEEMQNALNKACEAIGYNEGGLEGVYHHSTTLFGSVMGLIVYSLILTKVHPLIVAALLLLSVIQYVFHRIAERYERKHREEQAVRDRHQTYLFNQATDVKNGKDVRLFQLQSWLTNLFVHYNKEYQKQLSKNQRLYYLYDFVGLTLNLIRDAVCYGYLIYLLTEGMSVGEFVLYIGVVGGYGTWFCQISDAVSRLSRCLLEVNYFRSFIDMENVYLREEGKELPVEEGVPFDIVLDDVSFQYPNSDRVVLEHISVHIKKGEKIALVGVNGAGKTTLVKMLCGFYKPTSGHIYINGVDVTELNIEKYFEQVSVLFQDSVLLSYTIAENVTGQISEEIDREKLWRVLERSGLAEKIRALSKEENTFLGKDVEQEGILLSGGQIQKLFLARALYKDTKFLILDEPTAALDALAESEMYEKYAELTKDKTSVFISHRLSSTRFCDRILFLENGRIVESGTHEELLKKGGSYASMFKIQSQYYVKEELQCE